MSDAAPSATGREPRPWWMTALAVFCAVTVVFLAARDLLSPRFGDVEVWFGFELRGRAAQLTAPLHWAIFALGAFAFWTQRPWSVPAGAGYGFYVALSHLVWSEVSPNGSGWRIGLLHAALLSLPGWLLLLAGRRRARRRRGRCGQASPGERPPVT